MLSKRLLPYIISLALVAGIAVYACNFLSNTSHDYAEQNRILSQLADERAKKIADALEEEKRQHAAVLLRMQAEFDKNREEYERKIRDLEVKKRKEVTTFVDNHGDDPKRMADELSKSTGFKVYNGK